MENSWRGEYTGNFSGIYVFITRSHTDGEKQTSRETQENQSDED